MSRPAQAAVGILALTMLGFFVRLGFVPLVEGRFVVADYCAKHGHKDTGAPNIVAAVYLGYRAYDTLGEAIILVLGVIGTAHLLGGVEKQSLSRTQAGKLSLPGEGEKEDA